MLKRRLSKNTARAVGHNNNAQQPLHSNGGIGMSDNPNTVAAVPPKAVPANTLPALPSSTQNLILNRRVYPNGCLKKASSVKSTEREELLSSNNETIGRSTSTNIHAKINTTMSVTSSNASAHTTSSTKSTSPPPPPPPMVSLTSSLSSLQQQPVSTTDVEGVGNATPPQPHHQQHQQLEKKKSVSFQEVYIREFERILGDNPSCSSGAPISLGWKYAMDKSLPIDAYEERQSKYARRSRGSTGSSRHGAQDELILSRHDRESLLIEWGVTFNEMIDAIRTNVKIKNQRRRTVNAIGTYDRIEEIMENTASKLKGKLTLKKKNSTGNGTVVASHNHGAAVTPTRTTISSKQQQKQKQRELLHSNHIHTANYTVSGRGSDHLSIRSIVSSDNSNSTSSVFGGSSSDKVSNSTTTSTSNVAVCFDEKNYNNRLGIDHTDTVSVDAVSEVNDFSTIVRTPASSIIDTKNDTHNSGGSGDGVDTNPTTVLDTNNSVNNDVNEDAVKISSTLYDLDDEIENELAAAATKKTQKKKYRSSSFDDRRSNMNVNEDSIIPRRPPFDATTKVVLEPIIGVDIPRDVKLQRSMSIESGLTYDPHLMNAENNYDYDTLQKVNDDDISTLAYDTEHDTTDYQDGTEQEGTDHDATDYEDVTIPSKFLKEFNELMMADSHPNLLNKTINHSDEYEFSNAPKSALPGTSPTDELLRHPEKNLNTFPADSRPTYNHQPQPLHANTYYAIGEDNHDGNNLDLNTAKSLMTENEYDEIYLQIAEHPLSPVSELTGMDRFQNSFNSRSTASSYMYRKLHPEDGDFDKLQRDSSFWGICPGEHDAPQLQRVMMPVVITEDASVGQSAMNHFDTQANELSRISEGQHYMNNHDPRYQSDHDVHINTSYQNMMFSSREMIHSQQIGSMGLSSQYMLPASGTPIPNLMNSQNVGLKHQHRQHDIVFNNGMMQHPFPNALYPTPQYPSPLMVPTAAYASTIEYVPPELMYNIENGQHQYRLNEHHAPMYNYETETVDIANTQRWDEHGFRMEPPPNSTTLLHKMMM